MCALFIPYLHRFLLFYVILCVSEDKVTYEKSELKAEYMNV